nr:hypothetical protein BaRGS_031227 [Batillaria attramentaria]
MNGSEYGLKLTLNVEQYEYMPGPHDAAGVKMLLHDGKEFPGVAELGLAIPTGTHAYVGIQLVSIENLPEPHGDCGSLSSPFYKDYSTENCQLACLTEYMEEACGCRHPYMPDRNGTPPICTLEQYYGCYLDQIGSLKAKVRDECTCPIPCEFLIFDPALSFATTSVFATDRFLAAASGTGDMEAKYLKALEVTNRMEDLKFQRFLDVEETVRTRLEELSFLMSEEVRERILLARDTVDRAYNRTKTAWEKKDYLYRWQEYHVRKNFMRPRDAMNERTFDFLCMGFQEFANLTETKIWQLVDPEINSSDVRQTLFALLMTSLNARMDLAERAFANFTQLYDAYYNGTPVFRDEYDSYRKEFDFRNMVGNADSLFLKSLEDLMTEMERYLKSSVIETDFIRENFLQLDVFYREKSYEQITQQKAYDLFALLFRAAETVPFRRARERETPMMMMMMIDDDDDL